MTVNCVIADVVNARCDITMWLPYWISSTGRQCRVVSRCVRPCNVVVRIVRYVVSCVADLYDHRRRLCRSAPIIPGCYRRTLFYSLSAGRRIWNSLSHKKTNCGRQMSPLNTKIEFQRRCWETVTRNVYVDEKKINRINSVTHLKRLNTVKCK